MRGPQVPSHGREWRGGTFLKTQTGVMDAVHMYLMPNNEQSSQVSGKLSFWQRL